MGEVSSDVIKWHLGLECLLHVVPTHVAIALLAG